MVEGKEGGVTLGNGTPLTTLVIPATWPPPPGWVNGLCHELAHMPLRDCRQYYPGYLPMWCQPCIDAYSRMAA